MIEATKEPQRTALMIVDAMMSPIMGDISIAPDKGLMMAAYSVRGLAQGLVDRFGRVHHITYLGELSTGEMTLSVNFKLVNVTPQGKVVEL